MMKPSSQRGERMPRLSIVLPEDEHQALCDLALREWREPREQAGYMIAEGLKHAATNVDHQTVTGGSPEGPRAA
jgi:hypothetical protein